MDLFLPPGGTSQRPSLVLRMGVALITTACALGLSNLFRPLIIPVPFILFFAAIAITSAYSGFWLGVLSALVSVAFTNYLFLSPGTAFPLETGDLLRGAVFVFIASLISWLSEARRQEAARAFAQAERFYVTLASLGDAVIVTDSVGDVQFLNPRAEALTGWSRAEAEGQTITAIFPIITMDTRQPVENPVMRVVRDGAIVGLANHTLLIAKDGSERPIDDSGAPIRDRTGQLIGVVLVFRDITERMQAEAALQASRDQLAIILGGIADGVIAQTPDGQLVYVNDAAARAVGFSSRQAMLDAPSAIRRQSFVIMDEAGQPLAPQHFPGRLALQGLDAPARVIRYRDVATSQERWAFVQARPVWDAQHRVQMAISLLHDITDAKHAEAERERLLANEQHARAATEDALRLRDHFLSVAAHELKTPLTTLVGQVQLFQRRADRDGHLSERDQRTLRIINDQLLRLNTMVQRLLDVSRIETGHLSIERASVDLCALVQRVVSEVQVVAEGRSIALHCLDTPRIVDGDALRLEQVVQNLVQNALKYSHPPTPITVTVTQSTAHVVIAVQDHGIGIPQEVQSLLFQRFYRAPNVEAHHIGGLGIGLYVVKEIVALHGGEIRIESTEGVGSTFTVCLPLARE